MTQRDEILCLFCAHDARQPGYFVGITFLEAAELPDEVGGHGDEAFGLGNTGGERSARTASMDSDISGASDASGTDEYGSPWSMMWFAQSKALTSTLPG